MLIPRSKVFTLPDNITTVYFGNSTVECAVNDSLIPHSFNFAKSAETLDKAYAKIKLIHENNPNIDTVVLGFDDILLYNTSYHGLSKSHIFYIDKYSIKDWAKTISGFSFERNTSTFSHLYDIQSLRPVLSSFLRPTQIKSFDLGRYLWLERDKLNIAIERRDSIGKREYSKTLDKFPEICKYYLDNIVDYCNTNDLKLIFLNTPKHNYIWADTTYREIYSKYYFQKNIPLIDDINIIFPDSCYGDCVHLNHRGAKAYASILRKEIDRLK